MKIRSVRYLILVALGAPLLLSGCGDNNGVPIPTPAPVGPTNTPAPTRTATRAAATATQVAATATRTSAAATATATHVAPTPTATATATTATPTSPAGGPAIMLDCVTVAAGQMGVVTATLKTCGRQVYGTQNDFTFVTAENRNVTVVRKTNGRPDCTVNPDINKGSTTFAFQPPSCTEDTCTAVRALVFSSENVDPIPDGSTLYTCKVQVAATAAPGCYPLPVRAASDPPCSGNTDGKVCVP